MTELLERVARAICWAMAEETDDCSSVCMNAKSCMADKVQDCFIRDATAAIATLSQQAEHGDGDAELIEWLRSEIDGAVMPPERREKLRAIARRLSQVPPAVDGEHPLARMTRLDEEMGLYDDGARVPYAGLEGAEDWEVGPCVDRLGHVTSWDINIKPEPDAKSVAVIASVYSGEKVARAILAAIKDNLNAQTAPALSLNQRDDVRAALRGLLAFIRDRWTEWKADAIEPTTALDMIFDRAAEARAALSREQGDAMQAQATKEME